MLDFPQFTKKTFPGVYQMDLWSSLFGDSDDANQFVDSQPNQDPDNLKIPLIERGASCFVSGHDFSRAVKEEKMTGFSPWVPCLRAQQSPGKLTELALTRIYICR